MSTSNRIEQVAGHLNYPRGMLAGQVAIITGSGQGIGAEAARLFAKEGAKVVVSDVDGGMWHSSIRGLRIGRSGVVMCGWRGRVGKENGKDEWRGRRRNVEGKYICYTMRG